jgi:nickel superoxide dismutase
MLENLKNYLVNSTKIETAEAHCDGPCGVYDPASIRIAAEAVVAMTKKILDLKKPEGDDKAYANTLSRFISVKEEQATVAKREMLVLWTDYFKPNHLEQFPNLHETFWKATKLCSACKYELSLEHCEELMAACKEIHDMFWASKNREVAYYTAS